MCAAVDAPFTHYAPLGAGAARPTTPAPATAERFLVALLAAQRDLAALKAAAALAPDSPAGWQEVAAAARDEWLGPLLYRLVHGQGLVPAAVEDSWRDAYYESLRRGTLLFHELEALLRGLASAGVPVILLKGAALAETVYGNLALRPMTDLDLLVRREDVPAALQALREAGYFTDEPFSYFAEVEARKHHPAPTLVELHWALLEIPHYQQKIAADWLWQTARPASIGAVPARILGPEAQLLHLCAHMVLQHRDAGRHLLWQNDLAEVLRHNQNELDWPALCAAAGRFDLVLPLQAVLPQVVDAYGLPRLPRALGELRPTAQELRVYRSFKAAAWSPSQLGWVSLATMPGWQRRLSYLWANLFPSGAYVRRRYQVRWPALTPVYYVWRWLDGLAGIVSLLPTLLRRRLTR